MGGVIDVKLGVRGKGGRGGGGGGANCTHPECGAATGRKRKSAKR